MGLFYITRFKGDTEWSITELDSKSPDTVWGSLINRGFEVTGCFGRKDYADCYLDFYNGEIDMKELMLLLEAKSESESDDSV